MVTRKKAARPATRKATKKSTKPPTNHDAMMAAWQKAMTPSKGHRRLEPLAGTFSARTTFTMAPGAPPEVSEARSENRFVLGGRHLEQAYSGSSMGMPFEGLGFTGFDNVLGKYVGTWMDTFGTGTMRSESVGKPTDRRIDFVATAHEPSGRKMTFDCRLRIRDGDHHSFEMWTKGPGGKKYRVMLTEYART